MGTVRVGYLVVGCVLIGVGLVLIVVGHGRIEPVPGVQRVTLLHQLGRNMADVEPGAKGDTGYLTMGIGAFMVVAGILVCAASLPAKPAAP